MIPSSVFFGTSSFSVIVLDELKKAGLLPTLIVTAPDRPKGRGLALTPSPVKQWSLQNSIPFLDPSKLDDSFTYKLKATSYQLFIVASFGKIIPQKILDIPQKSTLNVHPSLLPLYRGPSPIQSQILEGIDTVGVTIMVMDEDMDHGPILAQEALPMPQPLPTSEQFEKELAILGGELLARVIPEWLAGTISPQEQDHGLATYTKKFEKSDGLIDLSDNPEKNFRKIRALSENPGTYFFTERNGPPSPGFGATSKKIRVKITDAEYIDGKLILKRVIPEGKREMTYEEFLRG